MQKVEVLIRAYSEISLTDIAELVDVFRADFDLFNYTTKPDFIFNKDNVNGAKGKPSLFEMV